MAEGTSISLLERVRGRDGESWKRLTEVYRPLILFWCERGGVVADAEDVSQEVFLAVARGLPEFQRPGPGGFRAWVRGITRHKVLDHFRKRHGDPGPVGGTAALDAINAVPDPVPGSAEDESESSGLCRRALNLIRSEFEERSWLAFWRTAVEGRDTGAVAAELNMSPTAVRIAKSRVLARLRAEAGDLIE